MPAKRDDRTDPLEADNDEGPSARVRYQSE